MEVQSNLIPVNQIAEKYRMNSTLLYCLQFLNDDNDLIAAEQLLADDFPTFDVSFNQMIADLSPNIAAVPPGLESTRTKTKTTTATTQQDKAADVSRFPVVSNEDTEELKTVAVKKYFPLEKTVEECF